MMIFSIDLVLLIPALMISATPVLLAAIGEAVVEKSGVLNLGVEGMMITGAVIGFIIAVNTQIPIYGFICAAIAGALLSVLFNTHSIPFVQSSRYWFGLNNGRPRTICFDWKTL